MNGFCFQCIRHRYKKIYNFTKGSFFDEYKQKHIEEIIEIFKCFIEFKFNVTAAYNYLRNTRHINLSEAFVRKVYDKIRKYIYYYYLLEYNTEFIGDYNQNRYYAIDESMFCHDINKQQLWVLGLLDTKTKEFPLVVAKHRNTESLKSFIKKLIPEGNNLVTDGWHGYDWVDNANSGYTRYLHIHDHHDFGYGPESTSHIESIWAQLKSEIKTTYKMIPCQKFLYFLLEVEWKIKTKNLNYEEKLQDYFEKYNLVVTVGESNIFDSVFLNNDDLNLIINSE